jgi:hypothetical protein
MSIYPIDPTAGYQGCGRVWAAIVDGRAVAVRYKERRTVMTGDGPTDNWGGRSFADYRLAAKAELAQLGQVVSGTCSCWEFIPREET